ncbi:hypothetical protein ACJJTC_006866 [Scirpophaga incertulas]
MSNIRNKLQEDFELHTQGIGRRLTTGLSSPRSESRSASAMAYAGTGSRFFTRILAASLTKGRISHFGTCSHPHTRESDIGTAIRRYERRRCSRRMVCRAGRPAPPPRQAPP